MRALNEHAPHRTRVTGVRIAFDVTSGVAATGDAFVARLTESLTGITRVPTTSTVAAKSQRGTTAGPSSTEGSEECGLNRPQQRATPKARSG